LLPRTSRVDKLMYSQVIPPSEPCWPSRTSSQPSQAEKRGETR
jgi:hypothetical protein